MDIHSLPIASVHIEQLEIGEQIAAYNAGKIDAVVTFEPVRQKLLAAGAIEVFNSREIPGEIVDVVVVRGDYLEGHSDRAETLLRGWFKALKYLKQNPNDAASKMSGRLGQSPSDVLKSYDGLLLPSLEDNMKLLGGSPPGLLETARNLRGVMLLRGLLRTRFPVTDIFSAEILDRIPQ